MEAATSFRSFSSGERGVASPVRHVPGRVRRPDRVFVETATLPAQMFVGATIFDRVAG
jgi:hypothetical protein